MVTSRSSSSREEIVRAVTQMLGPDQVDTDPARLRESSVDRFRKYSAVHGIYDGPLPAAVVYPVSTEQVTDVLGYAERECVAVVPRTGGTSTEGGLETVVEDSLVVDGSRMNRILDVDTENMTATAQCGVPLQVLEDHVRQQGLTTGHSPQSKPIAQMGGLVATRSIGQFSTLYGGIEDMVVGLEAVLPGGHVTRIKNVPRRAAGPDIRHVLIGNEGALAYITEASVKLFRYYPDNTRYFGFLVPDFDAGVGLLREVIAAGYRPSVARLTLRGRTSALPRAPDGPEPRGVHGGRPDSAGGGDHHRHRGSGRSGGPHQGGRRGHPLVVRGPQLGAGQDRRREAGDAGDLTPRLHHRGVSELVSHRGALRRGDDQDPYHIPPGWTI